MVTIIDDGRSSIAKQYYKTLITNRAMAEIMRANDDIMQRNNIYQLPAAIMSDGRIIYASEMKDIILKYGGASSENMI